MVCEGPCLEHCYRNIVNNEWLYLLVGILIGYIIKKYLNQEKEQQELISDI